MFIELCESIIYNCIEVIRTYNIGGENMLIPKIEEIKTRRLSIGLSQRQLSIKANLPDNALCRIEKNCFSSIYPIRAKAIAEALQCDIYDIFESTSEVTHEK